MRETPEQGEKLAIFETFDRAPRPLDALFCVSKIPKTKSARLRKSPVRGPLQHLRRIESFGALARELLQ